MLTQYREVVLAQPVNLERSRKTVSADLAAIDLEPFRTGLFAIAAMGASTHGANALVNRLVRHHRRVVNWDASELLSLGQGLDVADSFLFISEGGRSRETIAAAQLAPAGRRLALTNNPSAPLSRVTDVTVELGHGEDSMVYTIGYTATLQAFGLLATALDGVDDGDDWQALPGVVSETLSSLSEDAKRVAGILAELTSLDFVGCGASYSAAAEAGLLFREATRIPTAAYRTHQYLHGPMEPMGPQQGCMLFGDEREVSLAKFMASKGVPTVLVTTTDTSETENLSVMRIPPLAPLSRAVLEIVPAQLVVGEAARLRGLAIDGFRYHQDDTKIDEI